MTNIFALSFSQNRSERRYQSNAIRFFEIQKQSSEYHKEHFQLFATTALIGLSQRELWWQIAKNVLYGQPFFR